VKDKYGERTIGATAVASTGCEAEAPKLRLPLT
jgi:hypothetical protein